MKKIFLLFLLTFNLFAFENLILKENNLSEDAKVLLESISHHAIKIGKGNGSKTYIFVDPMCPFSKKYISMVSKSKIAQALNTYYIFLYRLPKFDSNKLCQHIYQSEDLVAELQAIMIKDKKINLDKLILNAKEQKKINDIAKVGKKLNIKIRPYIMSFKKNSNYCTVSSGSAPCLEEFDF